MTHPLNITARNNSKRKTPVFRGTVHLYMGSKTGVLNTTTSLSKNAIDKPVKRPALANAGLG
jgi:hypothetical protein